MYPETGILYPYLQSWPQEVQQQLELEDLCSSQYSVNDILSSFSISDYELGEGNLFKAPDPIIEPVGKGFDPGVDPMQSAMSMISCSREHPFPTDNLNSGEMESLRSEGFYETFRDCKKDVLGSTSSEIPTEILDVKLQDAEINLVEPEEQHMISDLHFQNSDSSGCFRSLEWVNGNLMKPSLSFLDFSELEFEAAYGMRRAFSEGDIKSLGNCNVGVVHSPVQTPLVIGSCSSEDRLEKLSRYRKKKSRRNFGRKIKYACRKALADSQPRIRGRFAKTEGSDCCKGNE